MEFTARLRVTVRQVLDMPDGLDAFAKSALRLIADERNLYAAMRHLYDRGGCDPGPDGVRHGDVPDESTRFAFCRGLRDDVKDRSYAPGMFTPTKRRKTSGGARTIAVRNLRDRVVQRAVFQVLGAALDRAFCDHLVDRLSELEPDEVTPDRVFRRVFGRLREVAPAFSPVDAEYVCGEIVGQVQDLGLERAVYRDD